MTGDRSPLRLMCYWLSLSGTFTTITINYCNVSSYSQEVGRRVCVCWFQGQRRNEQCNPLTQEIRETSRWNKINTAEEMYNHFIKCSGQSKRQNESVWTSSMLYTKRVSDGTDSEKNREVLVSYFTYRIKTLRTLNQQQNTVGIYLS